MGEIERPILFSGEMVNAILAGNKTQTRRVMKPQPPKPNEFKYSAAPDKAFWNKYHQKWWLVPADVHDFDPSPYALYEYICPYGVPGDKLWVRETFAIHNIGGESHTVYRADSGTDGDGGTWKPSIFMPRHSSRITLEVVNVRVERLQSISNEDAIAEGVTFGCDSRDWYAELWDTINAKRGYSWESNPWLWVIEFKPI